MKSVRAILHPFIRLVLVLAGLSSLSCRPMPAQAQSAQSPDSSLNDSLATLSSILPGASPIPIPANVGDNCDHFAPRGWTVFKSAQGDLNHDGRPDFAGIIVHEGDDPTGFSESDVSYPRALVVALSQSDGSFKRAAVGYGAVMCGKTVRNFALYVLDIDIKNGNIIVTHSSGASYAQTNDLKFREQNGQFELIGVTLRHASLREENKHESIDDRNLNTGYVMHSFDPLTKGKRPEIWHCYSLRAGMTQTLPIIDGRAGPGEWAGQSVHLNHRENVIAGLSRWSGPADFSALVQAARTKEALYFCAQVTGKCISGSDQIRLVGQGGKVILPVESKSAIVGGQETIEGRFNMSSIPKSYYESNEYAPARLMVSLEIVGQGEKPGAGRKSLPLILSSGCGGGGTLGEISLCKNAHLPRVADWSWEHPDD